MRIIEGKLEGKTEEEKDRIRKAGRIIADAYGTKKPRIAIIPESLIKGCKADFDSFNTNEDKKIPNTTIFRLAEDENKKWIYSFESGPNFDFEGGVVLYDKVTPDKFITISIPDSYDLLQMYAVQRGANSNDLINPDNGQIVERHNEKSLTTQKKKNIFLQFFERFKINPKQSSADTIIQEPSEKYYEDMRKNQSWWYWCYAFM